MALDNEQKKAILQQMLDGTETEIFRQEAELAALNAEADAVKGADMQQMHQNNIDNVSAGIARLRARQGAWQSQLDAIK